MSQPKPPVLIAAGVTIAGKYRLVRQIGEGAMGVVWSAVNVSTAREVALKLIHRPEAEFRLRLQREARNSGALRHRNIIDIYDMGETEGGDPFLVMQLLSGETLAELLGRKRRLEPVAAAAIGRDVARALSVAHGLQIIHRDLKPANIFMHSEPDMEEPVVKVLDFGVAKNLAVNDGLHTMAGGVVGSPLYMSPEQVRADATVDHRTDIWALGVVLFELLTGVRPFQGDAAAVYTGILAGETPLVTRYLRRIDQGFVDIVSRCMQKNRDERFSSATEIAALLDRIATAGAADASVPNRLTASGAQAPGSGPGGAAAPEPEATPSRPSHPGFMSAGASVVPPLKSDWGGQSAAAPAAGRPGTGRFAAVGAGEAPPPVAASGMMPFAASLSGAHPAIATNTTALLDENSPTLHMLPATDAPDAMQWMARRSVSAPGQAAPAKPAEATSASGQAPAAAQPIGQSQPMGAWQQQAVALGGARISAPGEQRAQPGAGGSFAGTPPADAFGGRPGLAGLGSTLKLDPEGAATFDAWRGETSSGSGSPRGSGISTMTPLIAKGAEASQPSAPLRPNAAERAKEDKHRKLRQVAPVATAVAATIGAVVLLLFLVLRGSEAERARAVRAVQTDAAATPEHAVAAEPAAAATAAAEPAAAQTAAAVEPPAAAAAEPAAADPAPSPAHPSSVAAEAGGVREAIKASVEGQGQRGTTPVPSQAFQKVESAKAASNPPARTLPAPSGAKRAPIDRCAGKTGFLRTSCLREQERKASPYAP